MKRTNFEANIWPPRLQHLRFLGNFRDSRSSFNIRLDGHFFESFRWPDTLTSLTVENYSDFESHWVYLMIQNCQLSKSLRRLVVYPKFHTHDWTAHRWARDILLALPRLRFLSLKAFMLFEIYSGVLNYQKESGNSSMVGANTVSRKRLECFSLQVIELWPFLPGEHEIPLFASLGLFYQVINSQIQSAEDDSTLPPLAFLRAIGIHEKALGLNRMEAELIKELDYSLLALDQLRQKRRWPRTDTSLDSERTSEFPCQMENLSLTTSPLSPDLSIRCTSDPSKSLGEELSPDNLKLEQATALMQAWDQSKRFSEREGILDINKWPYKHRYHVGDTGTDDGSYVGVYFVGGDEDIARRFGKGNIVW
jgi:hypothetical protein